MKPKLKRTTQLPSEATEPRDCTDATFEVLTKLHWEWIHAPYLHPDCDAHPEESRGSDKKACIVYIQHFTTDGLDFAYYICGAANLTKFLAGTFGMQAYGGSLFGTPIVLHSKEDLLSGSNVFRHEKYGSRVCKHGPQTERLRWRYLFETAKLFWSKTEFNFETLLELRKGRAAAQDNSAEAIADISEDDPMDGEDPGADWEIQSVTSSEAQEVEARMSEKKQAKMKSPEIDEPETDFKHSIIEKRRHIKKHYSSDAKVKMIAIRDNLEALKRRGGSVNDKLAYLTDKVMSKQENSVFFTLTEEQQSLVTSLNDVSNLLEELKERKKELHAEGSVESNGLDDLGSDLEEERKSLLKNIEANDEDALSEGQQAALEQFMEITGQGFEASVSSLAAQNWNAQTAISYWYDTGSTTSEVAGDELAQTIAASTEGKLSDEGPSNSADSSVASGSSNSSWSSINDRPSRYAVAGPSGKRQALDTPEELAASRARLERLIAQSQQSEHTPSSPQHDVEVGERETSPNSEKTKIKIRFKKPFDRVRKSPIARRVGGTALERTRSTEATHHEEYQSFWKEMLRIAQNTPSPSSPTASTLRQETNQVSFIKEGTTTPSQAPSHSPSSLPIPPTPIPPTENPSTETPAAHDTRLRKPYTAPNPTTSTSAAQSSLQDMTLAESLDQAAEGRRDSGVAPALGRGAQQDNDGFEVEGRGKMRGKGGEGMGSSVGMEGRYSEIGGEGDEGGQVGEDECGERLTKMLLKRMYGQGEENGSSER
ncbi:Nn.00g098180.m01.CDS01 [Neocucurbitaria sp. VM-36]